MTPQPKLTVSHRLWRGVYAALLVLLPRSLRDRYREEMLDLYDRELTRSAEAGAFRVHAAAVAGLADLFRRALHERVVEERQAVDRGDWGVVRNSAATFAIAFSLLTILLVALSVRTRLDTLTGEYALNMVLYSVPFTAAITIPMAIFLAVLFTSLRRTRTSKAPRLAPLLAFASVVAVVSLVVNAEIVPRTNARLQIIQSGSVDQPRSDRSMTLSELRDRSRQLTATPATLSGSDVRESLANLEVEIHKKVALAAACVLLSLLAIGLARWQPGAGLLLQSVGSVVVFVGYYTMLTVGETLADKLVISPALGMWSANIMALLLALSSLWASRTPGVKRHARVT